MASSAPTPARDQHIQGPGGSDQAGQPHRRAVAHGYAPAAAEDAEYGAVIDHPDITPQGKAQTAGNGMPGDRRDHRLGQGWGGGPLGIAGPGDIVGAAGHLFQIGAGAKRPACPGQNGNQLAVIGIEIPHRLVQAAGGGIVQGVAHLWPIDNDRGNRALGCQ